MASEKTNRPSACTHGLRAVPSLGGEQRAAVARVVFRTAAPVIWAAAVGAGLDAAVGAAGNSAYELVFEFPGIYEFVEGVAISAALAFGWACALGGAGAIWPAICAAAWAVCAELLRARVRAYWEQRRPR